MSTKCACATVTRTWFYTCVFALMWLFFTARYLSWFMALWFLDEYHVFPPLSPSHCVSMLNHFHRYLSVLHSGIFYLLLLQDAKTNTVFFNSIKQSVNQRVIGDELWNYILYKLYTIVSLCTAESLVLQKEEGVILEKQSPQKVQSKILQFASYVCVTPLTMATPLSVVLFIPFRYTYPNKMICSNTNLFLN